MRPRRLFALLLVSGACGTETIELRTLEVTAAKGTAPETTRARLLVTRFDDREWVSDAGPEWMKVKLNGQYVTMRADAGPDGERPVLFVGAWSPFDVEPGTYLFELERPSGAIIAAQSITLAPGSHNEIVVYGPTGTERSLALLDSLDGVDPGQARVRVVNVMDSHIPLDVVSCQRSALGCPPGVTCEDGGGACGLIPVGEDCAVLASGVGYGEVWEAVVDGDADVRARVPVRVGDGSVDRARLGRSQPDAATFETLYPQHVWGPGDWFEVCTNYLQFQFVQPGTYSPRSPRD